MAPHALPAALGAAILSLAACAGGPVDAGGRAGASQQRMLRATGTVREVSPRRITLADGTAYELAEGVSSQNLRPGMPVEITYGISDGARMATDVDALGAGSSR